MIAEPLDLQDRALRDRAVRAARGAEPFDILLAGGSVIDTATGEVRRADVGLVGPLIASVHAPGRSVTALRTVDVTGKFIAPGLIDSHMHVESSMMTPRGYAQVVVPQGTTTICWDPHEFGNVRGLDGVRWAIAASRGLPLRVLVMAPSCVPSAPGLELAGADFGADELAEMLAWPEVIGVAEVMDMRDVLARGPRMSGIVGAGLLSGKLVCGHARGLAGDDLQGFAAAGIESDHEITTGDDLLAKLRAGFTVELRGSHDYVLPGAVAALNSLPRLPPTLTICTDDVFPDDLVQVGGMVDVLRRLVGYGLDPVKAITAATLHAALRLNRRDLGLVAPGRRADLAVFDNLETLGVARVFASGVEVATAGELTQALPPEPAPMAADSMKLSPMTADDFRIVVPNIAEGAARLRTIVHPRFTEWGEAQVAVRNGRAETPEGMSVMAVVHRHGRAPALPQVSLIDDWGTFRGAFATTVSHDSHNLTVFGRDPQDMAIAANALVGCGGGMAVAQDGRLLACLPLPVCGLVSDASPAAIAAGFAAIRAAADAIAEWKPPVRVFKAFVGATLACNPGPHLTDRGLTDGTTGEVFESPVLEATPA